MLRRVIVTIVTAILLISFGTAEAADFSVAVLPFEKGGNWRRWYRWEQDLLNSVTQLVTDRLANQPDLTIIERSRIDEIVQEQRFQHSGLVDTSTAVELGRLLGADLLVAGSVTECGWEDTTGLSIGGFSVSTSRASVRLSARIISTETGEILASLEGSGEETGAALSVKALENISFGSSEFKSSVLGKALSKAIDDFITEFTFSLDTAREKLDSRSGSGVYGSVVAVKGDYIIVDIGLERGVSERVRLNVYRLEKVPGLEEPVRIPVGTLEVISVDPHASVTKLVGSTNGAVSVGDVVEISK